MTRATAPAGDVLTRAAVVGRGSPHPAALLCGRYLPRPDEHVAVVVSGANTTAVSFGG